MPYRTSEASRIGHKKRVARNKDFIKELRSRGCQICGYNKHPHVLQFHHIDPTDKKYDLKYLSKGVGIDKIKIELGKCAVLCANCHIEVHAGLHPDYLINTPINEPIEDLQLTLF